MFLVACSVAPESLTFRVDPSGAVLDDGAHRVRLGVTVRPGAPAAAEDCVTSSGETRCARDGMVTWWRATSEGVEQGWTVAAPDPDGGLRLRIPTPDAVAAVEEGGDGPVLRVDGREGALVGTHLAAWDARGRALRVAATASAAGLELRVAVDGAAWPVTVDPVWHLNAVSASIQANTLFFAPADFDQDGFDDLVSLDSASAGNFFFLAGGSAGLSSATQLPTTDCRNSTVDEGNFVAGDFNGDSWPDLLVGSCVRYGSATGILNAGSANLTVGGAYPAMMSVTAGDFDGDGIDDVAGVGFGASNPSPDLAIWPGAPGGLAPEPSVLLPLNAPQVAPRYRVVPPPRGSRAPGLVVLSHGTLDGITPSPGWVERFDLPVQGFPIASSEVLAASDLGLGDLRRAAALDDFDGDGNWELVLSLGTSKESHLAVLPLLALAGTAPTRTWRQGEETADQLLSADVDGNGLPDLLAHGAKLQFPNQQDEGGTLVFYGGGWARQHELVIREQSRTLAAGDFDHDGLVDLAHARVGVTTRPSYQMGGFSCPSFEFTSNIVVYPGRSAPPRTPFDAGYSDGSLQVVGRGHGVRMVDVDGDGADDLLAWRPASAGSLGFVDLHLSGPVGPSVAPSFTVTGAGGAFADSVEPCDLDGDGDRDLVSISQGTDTTPAHVDAWTFTPGLGWASRAGWTDPEWFGTIHLACGDLNGDGAAEIVVGAPDVPAAGGLETGAVYLFHPDGTGPYDVGRVAESSSSIGYGGEVTLGDLNDDGELDLVVGLSRFGRSTNQDVSVWSGPDARVSAPADDSYAAAGKGRMELVVVRPIELDFPALFSGGGLYELYHPAAECSAPYYDRAVHIYDLRSPSTFAWSELPQAGIGGAFAIGHTHATPTSWVYSSTTRSAAGRVSFGPVRGRPLRATTCSRQDWESPEGVRADHPDSVAIGSWDHDGFDDLVIGSDGCADPDGCVVLFSGSPTGPRVGLGDDADGDGHPDASDCDDTDPGRYVGAVELPLDGVDSDCDGNELCGADADQDNVAAPYYALSCNVACQAPTDDLVLGNDCDDSDPNAYPSTYRPDQGGRDTNCDGVVLCFDDQDGDHQPGTAVVQAVTTCVAAGLAAQSVDCDDQNAAVFVGAVDLVGDGVDGDCDGREVCYRDFDQDDRPEMAWTAVVPPGNCSSGTVAPIGVADRCFGVDVSGDPDRDGLCSSDDACPTVSGEDGDGDGVCVRDACLGDDAVGDANGDRICDDVAFQLRLDPLFRLGFNISGDILHAPANALVIVSAGGGQTTVRSDRQGRARFHVPIRDLGDESGEVVLAYATTTVRGVQRRSNTAVRRVAFPPVGP